MVIAALTSSSLLPKWEAQSTPWQSPLATGVPAIPSASPGHLATATASLWLPSTGHTPDCVSNHT